MRRPSEEGSDEAGGQEVAKLRRIPLNLTRAEGPALVLPMALLMGVGTIAAFLLGLTVLSLLPITDSSQETRGAFVALEVPCVFGQVEDMEAQACVLPKLQNTEPKCIHRVEMREAYPLLMCILHMLHENGFLSLGASGSQSNCTVRNIPDGP